jgi:hypothetical protein
MPHLCASLCQGSKRVLSALGILGLLFGCTGSSDSPTVSVDTAIGGGTSTGGTSTGGTSTDAGTHALAATGGTSGNPGTSATGGAPANQDCTTWRSYPNCGAPCSLTVEQYCAAPSVRPCSLDAATICTRYAFGSTWERGCGYVRVEDWGDVGDRWINVWNETSGELVYHWFSGMYSSGCVPEQSVGTQPVCDAWVNACGDGGV